MVMKEYEIKENEKIIKNMTSGKENTFPEIIITREPYNWVLNIHNGEKTVQIKVKYGSIENRFIEEVYIPICQKMDWI